MRKIVLSTALSGLALACAATAQAAVLVEFPQSHYTIQPGGTVQVQVVLDFDSATADVLDPTPFDPVWGGGLQDCRFSLSAPTGSAALTLNSVPDLFMWTYAVRDSHHQIIGYNVSPQIAGSSTNVLDLWGDVDSDDSFNGVGYEGTTLATITLHDLGSAPGSHYELTLGGTSAWSANDDPGLRDALEYTPDGWSIDVLKVNQVQFGAAQIDVAGVPEPASLALMGLGVMGLLGQRLRRR